MNKNFNKLKRAATRYAILFSVLTGLGVGIFVSAVIMIYTKLFSSWDPMLLLIGVGVAVISSSVLYLILRPTDKRLAKKLDTDFSLDESVATYVEFRGQDGEVLQLQREDTERRLGGVKASRLRPKKLIAAFLIFALSLGALTGALIIPERIPDTEEEQPIDAFDKQWILAALSELIDMVKSAYMDETLRADVLDELQKLSDFVNSSELLSEMKAEAVLTVKAINSSMRSVNSALVIGDSAIEGYGENSLDLAAALRELSGTSVKKALRQIAESLKGAAEEDINHTADELNALVSSSGVRIDDPVVVIFKTLISATYDAAAASDSLIDEYDNAAAQLSPILIVQNVNKTIVTMVIDKLCELFGITQADLMTPEGEIDVDIREPGEVTPGEDEEEDDEDDDISGGGLGTGNTIYGSDDLIYDPNTGTYVSYGEILQRYFDAFTEQKRDGKIPSDFIDKLNDYFGALYGGSDEK